MPLLSRRRASAAFSIPAVGRPVAALVVVALIVAACSALPGASFDSSAACERDDRGPGLYPDLEARVLVEFDRRPADMLDSGRNCTGRSLGTLAARGYRTIEYAGATWETGGRSGVTIAIFRAPGLQPREVFDFYKAGALAAPKTDATTEGTITVAGSDLPRLDTLNDESFQTVVVAVGPEAGTVRIVIVASAIRDVQTREAHETTLRAAIDAALEAG